MSGCSWPSFRCCVNGATSARIIRRRFTTWRRRGTRASAWSEGRALHATRTFMDRIPRQGTRSIARQRTAMSKFSCIVFAGALVLGQPGIANAQQAASSEGVAVSGGAVDFGVRLTSNSGDPARNQRYRDLREGPTVDLVRYSRDVGKWVFDAGANHMGYQDQRYFANLVEAGKIRLSFEWNQVPLFNSGVTKTLYTSPSEGVFLLADSVQQGMEAGT